MLTDNEMRSKYAICHIKQMSLKQMEKLIIDLWCLSPVLIHEDAIKYIEKYINNMDYFIFWEPQGYFLYKPISKYIKTQKGIFGFSKTTYPILYNKKKI